MSADELEEMGPIDYLVIEWPDRQPTGEAAPLLVDLVDRGLIRVIDIAFLAKGEDGSVTTLELSALAEQSESLNELAGASSGLLSDEDAEEAAAALEPGTSAAILVYENRWAAPFAAALRRSGAQLVANGRIPVQGILAALDAAEESESDELLTKERKSSCQDCFEASPEWRSSPEPQPPSATASPAARGSAGPSRRSSRPRSTQEPPPRPPPAADPIEQLTKLGELRDKGVLTDEEFAAQKAKLLG